MGAGGAGMPEANDVSTTRTPNSLSALMNHDMNLWAPQVRVFLDQMSLGHSLDGVGATGEPCDQAMSSH